MKKLATYVALSIRFPTFVRYNKRDNIIKQNNPKTLHYEKKINIPTALSLFVGVGWL